MTLVGKDVMKVKVMSKGRLLEVKRRPFLLPHITWRVMKIK